MKALWSILRKELRRYFCDSRMLVALFLPGILIFILYGALGKIMPSLTSTTTFENETFSLAYNEDFGEGEEPLLVTQVEAALNIENRGNTLIKFPISSENCEVLEQLKEGKYDVYLDYSPNFEEEISSENLPTLNVYYNGSSEKATYLYELASSLISYTYNGYLLNQENGVPISPNVSDSSFRIDQIASFLIPFLTITFLFSPIMSLAPESIAGEKERGTLGLLLLTPIPRSAISWGKILAISLASLASALVSFCGVFFSLPSLLPGLHLSLGNAFAILFLFFVSIILFDGIGVAISSFSKSIKEANAYLGSLLTIMMVIALLGGILDLSSIGFAFIPILNIPSCMSLILKASTFPWLYFAITTILTTVFAFFLVFVANRLFQSEKVLYRK